MRTSVTPRAGLGVCLAFIVLALLPGGSAAQTEREYRRGARFPEGASVAQAERESLPRARFPARVQTIDGKTIDVARLAETRRVVVVTLKATSCPVCQEQLRRIHRALPDPERCGIALLVLSPGPADALKEIRSGVGLSYPFIEDRDLSIATSFGLRLARDQMEPAILVLERDLSVGWMQRGRSGAYFGDPALQREINCAGVI